jgi:DNA repair protein RecO (recombination protein O)
MVQALGRPLADAPAADDRALGQVERAIAETLEHHAHVRLKPAAPRPAGQPA